MHDVKDSQATTAPPPARTCGTCRMHERACAYCELTGERRRAHDPDCGQWTDGKMTVDKGAKEMRV